jgi:hypothetical protein
MTAEDQPNNNIYPVQNLPNLHTHATGVTTITNIFLCNGFYYTAEDGLGYKLEYHLVFRNVSPNPTNNKNTT